MGGLGLQDLESTYYSFVVHVHEIDKIRKLKNDIYSIIHRNFYLSYIALNQELMIDS